jgi:hypothetical protein
MTIQSENSDFPFDAEDGDGPRISTPPKMVVRLAAVAILGLAALGLARGVLLSRPAGAPGASPLSVLAGLSPQAAANAKPATMVARDDNWSVLSGPQMVDAAQKPKVEAKPAASDDEDDDSDSPAAQTAAADAIAPDAPDAAPAAPAASSTAGPATAPPPPPPPPAPAPQ